MIATIRLPLAAIALALCLGACSGSDTANPDTASPDTANPDTANPDTANPDTAVVSLPSAPADGAPNTLTLSTGEMFVVDAVTTCETQATNPDPQRPNDYFSVGGLDSDLLFTFSAEDLSEIGEPALVEVNLIGLEPGDPDDPSSATLGSSYSNNSLVEIDTAPTYSVDGASVVGVAQLKDVSAPNPIFGDSVTVSFAFNCG